MTARLLDAVEVAELLHVPISWVRESTRSGAIPHVQLGRQARAGHAQATMTERYVHAAQVAFPGAAERAEDRLFAGVET